MVKLGKGICIILLSVLFLASSKEAFALQNQNRPNESVKIGLLIADSTSIEARNGAELAIKEVNEQGGIHGRRIKLITRSMEGVWGSGSSEVVDLVFNEDIWAILGSHDGRNAHLVEQVIAKTRVVFLSAWASDPTLSQAYVPWYFSAVPNDIQQANALIEEIYTHRKHEKLLVVLNHSYDSKMAWKSLRNEINISGKAEPRAFFYDNAQDHFEDFISEIRNTKATAIILIGEPPQSWNFIDQLRLNSIDLPIYGNLSILGEGVFSERQIKAYDQIILMGSEKWLIANSLSFQNRYFKEYNSTPGAVAVYAYDGMKVLINALETSKLNREKIRESMLKNEVQGFTGLLSFDERGRRINTVDLSEIIEGIPVLINNPNSGL
jgi:branched-chain amino acid transport system substrate-binding protein